MPKKSPSKLYIYYRRIGGDGKIRYEELKLVSSSKGLYDYQSTTSFRSGLPGFLMRRPGYSGNWNKERKITRIGRRNPPDTKVAMTR